ncbi:MAG TPA: universal stress protein [Chitinophagaceae bacterium]|nr:universal stress protein [Chitinophagaceae bacterium]
MKKFLAVFDGYKMSKSTLEYAIQLTWAADAHLVGVFLDEFIYRNYNVTKVIKIYNDYDTAIRALDAKDKEKRDGSARQFQKACSKAAIRFSIHRDKSIAIQELKHESMFADLIIINENETFTKQREEPPTRFMKDLLGDVQCPVLVVPDAFRRIDKIVLLYDGGPSALFAVKMFSYLFGTLKELPVEVYTVNDRLASLRMPDNKLMREFIKRHFPKVIYTINKGNAEEQILGHLRNHKENELVVLGAYRRTELSRWFKKSMADVLMKELDTPLFIAHNK